MKFFFPPCLLTCLVAALWGLRCSAAMIPMPEDLVPKLPEEHPGAQIPSQQQPPPQVLPSAVHATPSRKRPRSPEDPQLAAMVRANQQAFSSSGSTAVGNLRHADFAVLPDALRSVGGSTASDTPSNSVLHHLLGGPAGRGNLRQADLDMLLDALHSSSGGSTTSVGSSSSIPHVGSELNENEEEYEAEQLRLFQEYQKQHQEQQQYWEWAKTTGKDQDYLKIWDGWTPKQIEQAMNEEDREWEAPPLPAIDRVENGMTSEQVGNAMGHEDGEWQSELQRGRQIHSAQIEAPYSGIWHSESTNSWNAIYLGVGKIEYLGSYAT